jgi:N-acetylglucosaminyl-diphospho-decaprenol L-rhamnosyltransferase
VDLAVVIVSANDAQWLEPCLSSVLAHAGDLRLELIVVDNASTDGTRELVEARFPQARVVSSPNRGFAYGNNRGLEHTSARYVLLLNPDTVILQGTFAELLATLDASPEIGLAGVRQVDADGALLPTIRRFPSASRALGEALASERWPLRPRWAGEREIDPVAYTRAHDCDWTAGSFMLIRREALLSAGVLDERFFLYSEETDLCLRIKRAGWRVHHLPLMTIRHHAGKAGARPALVAQDALSRKLYARKHLPPLHRGLYLGAVAMRHALRSAGARAYELTGARAPAQLAAKGESARLALRTLVGRADAPFILPPPTALGSTATQSAAADSAAAEPTGPPPASYRRAGHDDALASRREHDTLFV